MCIMMYGHVKITKFVIRPPAFWRDFQPWETQLQTPEERLTNIQRPRWIKGDGTEDPQGAESDEICCIL